MAERLELFAEARRISEQRLGSKALAFQWCARAFEAAAQNPDVRTDLERLAGEADEWGALAALYEARFAVSTDAEERIWLLRRVLRISATRLFKPQDTRRAAEQILAEVGYDEEADGALETVLTQGKAWPELAKLLHARADRAPDAAERVKLLLRIAQIEEERVPISPPRRAPGRRSSTSSRPMIGPAARWCASPRRGRTGLVSSRRCAAISPPEAPRRRTPPRKTPRSAKSCSCASGTYKRRGSRTSKRRSPRTARWPRPTPIRRRPSPGSSGWRQPVIQSAPRSRA